MAEYYDEHSPLLQPSKPECGLKGSSSGSQLSDLPANNSGQCERKRSNTMSTVLHTRLSPNMRTQLDVKGIGQHCSGFIAVCKDIQRLIRSLLKHQNLFSDGEFFSTKLLKSMEEMEKIIDHKAIFISVFGQHNCGKSSFLNALMGEEYLATSPMNETSMRVTIHHDSQVHPGFCCGDKCARKEYQTCPKLTKITMNSDTKVVIGPKNVQHELKHINEKVRQANATPLVTSLTLTVSLPLLTYNVPPGWTVSLVDTPGFGEANEYIQQLAEESVEVSAAYIYLLQTESIGGSEAKEMFASIAKKDQGAFADGRLIVAITKFDTNYQQSDDSGSDSDDEYNNASHCAHVKIEEKIKKKLYNHIEDATQLSLSPDFILPVCGQWALCGSKLDSYLSFNCNQSDTHYGKRLKAATDALSKHPKRSTLSIPGAQGQAELETIKQLHPSNVVQHLDKITGFECLKTKIQCMVGKCIKLWSKKVNREYTNYISEAKKKIDEKIVELEKNAEEIQAEQNLSESKNHDIISLYSEVHEYVTIKENSELWTKIAENYDEDIQGSRIIQEGKQLVSSMVEEFKGYCIQRFQQRSSECFGEAQFNEGISKLLSDTAEKLTTKFGTCHFNRITDTTMEDVHHFARKCEKLDQRARQLCSHLHIDTEELNIPLPPKNVTLSPSKILMLSDIKAKTAIPPVRISLWTKIARMIKSLLRIEKNDGCYSYREWNDELENVLRETEDLMKQKCESYFDEIKHETVQHFCKITTQNVMVDLIPYEQIYRPHIERGIEQLKQHLKELHDKQKDLKYKIIHLLNLQCQLEESFDKEFRPYI